MRYSPEYTVEAEIGEVLIISLNGINLAKAEISKILPVQLYNVQQQRQTEVQQKSSTISEIVTRVQCRGSNK